MPRSGDPVFWWRRITREIEYPYRAEVLAVGPKRVTIAVEDPDGANDRIVRHVAVERVQPVGGYYKKAVNQGPAHWEPKASWGKFTRYLEIGDDLRAVRHVDEYRNGNWLSYDRVHWVDEFGLLADGRSNRNRKRGPWGQSEEIDANEFERVWTDARSSPLWPRQVATARMAQLGEVPVWLTVRGWRPD